MGQRVAKSHAHQRSRKKDRLSMCEEIHKVHTPKHTNQRILQHGAAQGGIFSVCSPPKAAYSPVSTDLTDLSGVSSTWSVAPTASSRFRRCSTQCILTKHGFTSKRSARRSTNSPDRMESRAKSPREASPEQAIHREGYVSLRRSASTRRLGWQDRNWSVLEDYVTK